MNSWQKIDVQATKQLIKVLKMKNITLSFCKARRIARNPKRVKFISNARKNYG